MCQPSLESERPVGVTRWESDSSVRASSTSFVDFDSSFQSDRKSLIRRYIGSAVALGGIPNIHRNQGASIGLSATAQGVVRTCSMSSKTLLVLVLLAGAFTAASAQVRSLGVVRSANASFEVEVVAESLAVPVSIAFLPDGRALVAERAAGRIVFVDLATGRKSPLGGLTGVALGGDGGVLDVVLHPAFATNRVLYIAYSATVDSGTTTVVDRARLEGERLVDRRRIFTALPAVPSDAHFGGRLA